MHNTLGIHWEHNNIGYKQIESTIIILSECHKLIIGQGGDAQYIGNSNMADLTQSTCLKHLNDLSTQVRSNQWYMHIPYPNKPAIDLWDASIKNWPWGCTIHWLTIIVVTCL